MQEDAAPYVPLHDRQRVSMDDALLAILDAPLREHETAHVGFARKERELAEAMSRLTVLEAFVLRQRLAIAASDDVLAQTLTTRLTVERRNRLIAVLEGARRRAAIAGGK